MEKHLIRKQLLLRRKQLDRAIGLDLSSRIQQRLLALDGFSRAETLALYSPINNEVATELLLGVAFRQGKQVCFPRTCGEGLQFVTIESVEDLQPGRFGVAEPVGNNVLNVEQIDFIVVPGVAFAQNGFRLGYGKGFYDRELLRMPQATVSAGLCYDFQLCDRLPVESHDQPLDYVITETQLIPCYSEVTG